MLDAGCRLPGAGVQRGGEGRGRSSRGGSSAAEASSRGGTGEAEASSRGGGGRRAGKLEAGRGGAGAAEAGSTDRGARAGRGAERRASLRLPSADGAGGDWDFGHCLVPAAWGSASTD